MNMSLHLAIIRQVEVLIYDHNGPNVPSPVSLSFTVSVSDRHLWLEISSVFEEDQPSTGHAKQV